MPVLAIDDSAEEISAILIETFVEEQSNDKWCQKIKAKIDNGLIKRYRHDDRGLLVRVSPVYLPVPILVPEKLRPRMLYLAHFPKLAGHPGGSRMFAAMRREFYWP